MSQAAARLGALLCMVAASETVLAQGVDRHFGPFNSCFERSYSAEHLADHPDQTVTSLRVLSLPEDWDMVTPDGEWAYDQAGREINFRIQAKFRGDPQLWANSGSCAPEDQGLRCFIECDGGQFRLESVSDSRIALRNDRDGFSVYSCMGDDISRELVPGLDDEVFHLDRIPDAECVEPE